MNLDNIDFDSAIHTIYQDGSYLHFSDGLWGLYDFGESPDNPVVPYIFNTRDELIIWYFQDMGWNINLYLIHPC